MDEFTEILKKQALPKSIRTSLMQESTWKRSLSL